MRQKSNTGTPTPVDKYWDDTLKVWVKVYPMHVTKAYKRNCGASWNTRSGRSNSAGARHMSRKA